MNATSPRYLFTPLGLERLRCRIAAARASYQAVCDSNPEAREAGDSSVWHDNFAFEDNQRQMHQLARRVRDLEAQLEHAVVVGPDDVARDRVTLGVRVRYRLDDDPRVRSASIAGWDDGAPELSRIAYNSPLGAALLGARVGDERELELAGRVRVLAIVAIDVEGSS